MDNEVYEQLKWEITCTGEVMISDASVKIKELYGGFGQGQKILTVSQIAQLHVEDANNKEEIKNKIKSINQLINNNIILDSGDKYFEFGIDILDLKQASSNDLFSNLKKLGIYTQAQIGNATNLYILSEQGYSLLINLMKDTKSKIIYKKVIRDYFRMKDFILSSEDTERYILRLMSKKERLKTTDTIKYFIARGDLVEDSYHHPYATETNYIYNILFGKTAKEIAYFLGLELKKNDTIRNYISYEDVDSIRDIEGRVGYMMEDGKSYDQIKKRLKELHPTPRSPKLADKSISLIKRLTEKA